MSLALAGRRWTAFGKAAGYATADRMAKAIMAVTKKRGRPKTTGKGTLVGIRLHAPELALLDAWAAEHGCTRATALRRLAVAGLDGEMKRKR